MSRPSNALKERRQMNSNTVLLLITIALFIVLYAAGCIAYADRGFTNLQTFLNLFRTNAGLICVACGMTCVMLTGGIDISVGSLVALDCMLMAYGMSEWGISAPVMILLVLVIGLVFGLVQGLCVGYLEIQPFIVTMAGMFFARGMTAVISTNQLSTTAEINQLFYDMANYRIYLPAALGYANKKGIIQVPYIGIGVVVALVVLVIVFLVLRYTVFGRDLFVIGSGIEVARLSGIKVRKTFYLVYSLAGFVYGIAAIMFAGRILRAMPNTGDGYDMDAIAAAVIGGASLAGGRGAITGTFVGTLLMVVIKNAGKAFQINYYILDVITGALIIFAVAMDMVKSRKKA